jgi:Aldehyde dehydrogenase family
MTTMLRERATDLVRVASVWTRNRAAGERVAYRLNAGAVNIDNVFINLFQLPLPHHGWGSSGVGGRLGGAEGNRKYCHTKAVVSEKAAASTEIHWYPASNAKASIQGVSHGSRPPEIGDAGLGFHQSADL